MSRFLAIVEMGDNGGMDWEYSSRFILIQCSQMASAFPSLPFLNCSVYSLKIQCNI